MSHTLKCGLVGLGKMGSIRYRELLKHPDAGVTHGADPNDDLFAAYPDLECTTDWREVVKSDVDAIFVATPNSITPAVIIAALNAGKHVFTEKPPGRTVKDIEDIIRVESEHPELTLKFGFNHRYHAGIQEARRIVRSGRLGRLLWMRGIYGKAGGLDFENVWRSRKEIAGGGILLDQGIHMLDLFRFFCGDFHEIKSMVSTSYWPIDVEDNAFALLRDQEGRVAMLHSSSTHWRHRFTLELYMSEGYLSVDGILSSSRSYGDETITVARNRFSEDVAPGKPTEEVIYFDTDPSWELEIQEFVVSCLTGKPIEYGTSSDALEAMKLVFAIYKNDESFEATGNNISVRESDQPQKGKNSGNFGVHHRA